MKYLDEFAKHDMEQIEFTLQRAVEVEHQKVLKYLREQRETMPFNNIDQLLRHLGLLDGPKDPQSITIAEVRKKQQEMLQDARERALREQQQKNLEICTCAAYCKNCGKKTIGQYPQPFISAYSPWHGEGFSNKEVK